MKITKRLIKTCTEWAEAYLEYEYEHNCWLFMEEQTINYRGHEVTFSFEGCCHSTYAPEHHYLEGQYCGDTGGEVTIQSIEVQDLRIWDEENEEWIKTDGL